jgi:hypothetical protein
MIWRIWEMAPEFAIRTVKRTKVRAPGAGLARSRERLRGSGVRATDGEMSESRDLASYRQGYAVVAVGWGCGNSRGARDVSYSFIF